MIVYINSRLNGWADWVASGRKVIGLGYPGQCSFTRLAPVSGGLRAPIENEQAWEIEQAVHRLDSPLRDVVEQFYLRAGTVETHAKALRICRNTLYARLHASHVKIMEWLQVGDDEKNECLTRWDGIAIKQLG